MNTHTLYIGQGPDVIMIAEFLLRRQCHVENCADLSKILHLVHHRASQGTPYHLVFIDADLAGQETISLAQQLRQTQHDLVVALLVDFTQVNNYRQAAQAVGCAKILEKPIDLSSLERFIKDQEHLREAGIDLNPYSISQHKKSLAYGLTAQNEYAPTTGLYQGSATSPKVPNTNSAYRQSESTGDYERTNTNQFFGTSRMPHQADAAEPQTKSTFNNENTSGYRRHQSSSGYSKQPSGVGYNPNERRLSDTGATSRIRRSITGKYSEDTDKSSKQQQLRQNDDVNLNQPIDPNTIQVANSNTKKVACAHCRQVFRVLCKNEPYTVACIHCGQLNRIMP